MRTILALPRWARAAGGATILVVGGLAWYLASPLFISTTLVEESPFVVPAQVRAQSNAGAASAQRAPQESSSARPRQEGGVAGQQRGNDVLPAGAASDDVQILSMGDFSDRGQVHRGTGQAILARMGDQAILRFESFRVTNGPDLHVLLSRTAHPATHDQAYDGVYVGKLKASEGAFHYELPRDADLSSLRSVVVYCVPFRVIFTSAPLGPA